MLCVHDEVYSIQQYVINPVSDLRPVCDFLWVLWFPINKSDCHDITDILLKVALNTINQTDNKEQFVQLVIHFVLENYWH